MAYLLLHKPANGIERLHAKTGASIFKTFGYITAKTNMNTAILANFSTSFLAGSGCEEVSEKHLYIPKYKNFI